ncbi:hypothetical protein CUU64_18305 [Bacillus sp. V5-8f]|nr:hypothetical protein CUU64_18305 [Bacillus sp. V5-8f]
MGRPAEAKAQLTAVLNQVEQEIQAEEPRPVAKAAETIRAVKETVRQEPVLSKAIEQVKEAMKAPEMPKQAAEKIERAIREATQLQQIGRPAQAKTQLTEALNQVEQEVQLEEVQEISKLVEPGRENKVSTNNLRMPHQQTGESTPEIAQTTKNISRDNSASDNPVSDDSSENNHSLIKNLLRDVQKEPSLNKVLDKVSNFMSTNSQAEDMDLLRTAHVKAEQYNEQGRELAARREISNALNKLAEETPLRQYSENKITETDQYLINEAIQGLRLDSTNIVVTEISKKLSQMAIDFKQMKRDVTRNLDNLSRMMENQRVFPQENIKQVLNSTIHKIDSAILKSDVLLYTDMVTEKKLLTVSSKLNEAKRLLEKGDLSEANKLVKEVKKTLDNIIFKPSDVKIKHFVSEKNGIDQQDGAKHISNLFEQTVRPYPDVEPSGRQLFESVRRLGLTHENESAFSMVSQKEQFDQSMENENLKAALLKMMKNDEVKPHVSQQIEQAVNNITGQQLLNKQDQSGTQNLFFQLPVMIHQQIENVKIYINSRKEGEKIDWENCSLYFVLETKKLGDIGILLNASDRNLSITFRSNKDNLDEKVELLTEVTKERFQEIGYNLNSLGVRSLTADKETNINAVSEKQNESILSPTFTEKGYDFSI